MRLVPLSLEEPFYEQDDSLAMHCQPLLALIKTDFSWAGSLPFALKPMASGCHGPPCRHRPLRNGGQRSSGVEQCRACREWPSCSNA